MRRQLVLSMFALFWALVIVLTASDATVSAAPLSQTPCDNGRSEHAQGVLQDGLYTVVRGDTVYSVSRRFCVSEWDLRQANHMRHSSALYAGTKIIIPGDGSGGGDNSGDGSCTGDTTISISSPVANANVGATFQVSGQATVRRNSLVVVRAFDANGRQLDQRDTYLNWTGRNGNCLGTFAVTLAVRSVAPGTEGYIVATVAGVTSERVPVVYTEGGSTACTNPFLTIAEPRANERLPVTFTVSGQGCLPVGSSTVEVQALSAGGAALAARRVPIQNGAYRVLLTVNVPFEQSGRIVVTGLGTSLRQETPVVFTTSGGGGNIGSYTDFHNLNCRIVLVGDEPGFFYPNGPLLGVMTGGEHKVIARVDLGGVVWYMIEMPFQNRGYTLWAKRSDLASAPIGC